MTDESVLQLKVDYVEADQGELDYIVVSNTTEVDGHPFDIYFFLASVNKVSIREDDELKDRLLIFFTEHLQRTYEKKGVKVEFDRGVTH